MSFTVQNVVDLARDWLNDDDKVRMSDAKGERFVNAVLQALALMRPDLFTVVAAITPVADQAWQDIVSTDANAVALLDILAVAGGGAVTECNLRSLLTAAPTAVYGTSGTPTDWARFPADADRQSGTRYFLSPRPSNGTQLLAQYVRTPAYRTLAQTVLSNSTNGVDYVMAEAYRLPLAKAVQYCAETVDDEYVTQQRAMEGLQTFSTLLNAGATTKKVLPNP